MSLWFVRRTAGRSNVYLIANVVLLIPALLFAVWMFVVAVAALFR